MAERPAILFVDVGDGWKEARAGDRVILRFKAPADVTVLELAAFGEYILKLAREREHGPS